MRGSICPWLLNFINASLTGAEVSYPSKAAENIVKVNDVLAGLMDDEDE